MKIEQSQAEKDAIAAFIAQKGVTKCPPAITGDVGTLVKHDVAQQRRKFKIWQGKKTIKSIDLSLPTFLIANDGGIEAFATLPPFVRNQILAHMKISDLDGLSGIASFTNGDDEYIEEIWEPKDYVRIVKSFPDVKADRFSWGYVALGYLLYANEEIPTFFDQNASPVMFYLGTSHQHIINKIPKTWTGS